jgi:hypothetical protein
MILYNVPPLYWDRYRGLRVILRVQDPAEIDECLSPDDRERLAYVQVTDLAAAAGLRELKYPVALDLVMRDPETELRHLYECARLLDRHPVRITVPVLPGFSKAVRLAAALQLAVRLDVGQPDPQQVTELLEVLDLYLHGVAVEEPIEYFHSALAAFYHGGAGTLWSILEEDPAGFRYVTDEGHEVVSGRFVDGEMGQDAERFIEELRKRRMAEGSECRGCEFLDVCRGYFKRPREEYCCDGVKRIFRALEEAAAALKADVGGERSAVSDQPSAPTPTKSLTLPKLTADCFPETVP